jgi:glycerate 2-kinase
MFREAAAVFGPQKGATPEQVVMLERRLDNLAEQYRRTLGVDISTLRGAGAAGGLAGGLAAIGATVVAGVALVAAAVGLPDHIAHADLVITGEGRLDVTSFAGKVAGGVLDAAAGRVPVWCVVGEVDPALPPDAVPPALQGRIVSLAETFGRQRATEDTVAAVGEAVERFVLAGLRA